MLSKEARKQIGCHNKEIRLNTVSKNVPQLHLFTQLPHMCIARLGTKSIVCRGPEKSLWNWIDRTLRPSIALIDPMARPMSFFPDSSSFSINSSQLNEVSGFQMVVNTGPTFVFLPGNSDHPDTVQLLRQFLHPRPQRPFSPTSSGNPLSDEKIKHYFVNVIPIQYLLSEKSATTTLLCEAVQASPDIANAVRVLSAVHRYKCRSITPRSALHDTTDEEIQPVYNQLHGTLFREHAPSVDDAIAALLLVSSVLFDNGTGEWNYWLGIACTYLDTIFNRYPDISMVLHHHHQEPKFIFVLKTTFWFDVIASVTFNREPYFHAQIYQMFDPFHLHEHSISMVDTIGCHNHVFWALNQTSWLSTHWNDVNHNLQQRYEDVVKTEVVLAHHSRPAPLTSNDPFEISRFYTSQVFALTTRAWLETLKLGARPNVSSISDLIDDTLSWFAYIPSDRLIQRHTVRSLVFCIFMMGILTTRDTHRALLVMHLRCQSTDNIGNCLAIERVITTIWAQYDHVSQAQGRGAHTSVCWRDDLVSSGVLLV